MRSLIGLVAVLALLAAAPTARAQVTPEYFTLPQGVNAAGGLDVAPDGTVWFGAASNTAGELAPIGRLDPAQAAAGTANGITLINTGPIANGSGFYALRDVAWSSVSNTLWFTRSDGVVGRYANGTVNKATTTGNMGAHGVAVTPDGGAWVSVNGASNTAGWPGNRIARASVDGGLDEKVNLAFQNGRTTVDSARYDAKPRGMATTADGTPWFVQENPGLPGWRIATWSGPDYTEYFAPCATAGASPCSGANTGEGLVDVTVAADGSIWYTNQRNRSIGKLVVGGDITEFKLSDMAPGLGAGRPFTIKTAADGSLWFAVNGGFSAPGANAVVKINPADLTKNVYSLGAALQPLEVAPDTKGNVWVTGSPGTSGGPIARLAGVMAGPPPVTGGGGPVTPISQPVDTSTKLTPSVTTRAQISPPSVKNDAISANQVCVGPPQDKCSLIYLIQTREYVTGFPGVKGSAKPKLFTIGSKKVTLSGGQSAKVTVKLNKLGKKLFKKKKRFKATFTVQQTLKGAKQPTTLLKKNVTFKR
jgi:streptogramin lyase